MHIAGLMGMPRRVYTYPAGMGLELPNMLSSIGSELVALAGLVFVINMAGSFWKGVRSGPDPWTAASLEWATASPPPWYNFAHIPAIESGPPCGMPRTSCCRLHGLRVDDRELDDERHLRQPGCSRAQCNAQHLAIRFRDCRRGHLYWLDLQSVGARVGAIPVAIALTACSGRSAGPLLGPQIT